MARFKAFCATAHSPWLWLAAATVVAALAGQWAGGLWALAVFAVAPVLWLVSFTDLARRFRRRGKYPGQSQQLEGRQRLRRLWEPRS